MSGGGPGTLGCSICLHYASSRVGIAVWPGSVLLGRGSARPLAELETHGRRAPDGPAWTWVGFDSAVLSTGSSVSTAHQRPLHSLTMWRSQLLLPSMEPPVGTLLCLPHPACLQHGRGPPLSLPHASTLLGVFWVVLSRVGGSVAGSSGAGCPVLLVAQALQTVALSTVWLALLCSGPRMGANTGSGHPFLKGPSSSTQGLGRRLWPWPLEELLTLAGSTWARRTAAACSRARCCFLADGLPEEAWRRESALQRGECS